VDTKRLIQRFRVKAVSKRNTIIIVVGKRIRASIELKVTSVFGPLSVSCVFSILSDIFSERMNKRLKDKCLHTKRVFNKNSTNYIRIDFFNVLLNIGGFGQNVLMVSK